MKNRDGVVKLIAENEAELQREIQAALDRIGKIIGSPVGAIRAKMTCWLIGTLEGDFYVPYPDKEVENA